MWGRAAEDSTPVRQEVHARAALAEVMGVAADIHVKDGRRVRTFG